MDNFTHYSVLLNESITALDIKPDGIYVDCTLGGGGHSLEILKKLTSGHLYAFDQDLYALKKASLRLDGYLDKVTFINANFCEIKNKLAELGVSKVDGFIYDLGVSSFQLDIPERGFSYRYDAPLDMRMDTSSSLLAKDILNHYSFSDLKTLFFKYSGSKYSASLAKKVCEARQKREITTTFEFVDLIKSALPAKELNKKGHPAKVFFQALRIEVNNELAVLEKSLNDAIELLNVNGIIACITFQPDEDKIVKRLFKEVSTSSLPLDIPVTSEVIKYSFIKKKIKPSDLELLENNRSHSANLRVLKRLYE